MSQLLVAILTSLAAAVVFWLFFDLIPSKISRKKVQPIIDYDLYKLYQSLLKILELPFWQTSRGDTLHTEELLSGSLSELDFKTFLSTKCLSVDYQKIDEMSGLLIPIGDKLQALKDEISEIIKRLYIFNYHLNAEQILICRQLLDNLNLYSYDTPAFEKVKGVGVFHPVNPTVNYMSMMFNDLYVLFTKLQKHLMLSRSVDVAPYYQRGLDYIRVSSLYAHKWFRRVVALTKNTKNGGISSYYFRSLYMLKKKVLASRALVAYLRKNTIPLESMSYSFYEIIKDKRMCDVLIKERTQEEFDQLDQIIVEKTKAKSQFEQYAIMLRHYYDDKIRVKK